MGRNLSLFIVGSLLLVLHSLPASGAVKSKLGDALFLEECRLQLSATGDMSDQVALLTDFVDELYRTGNLDEANIWTDTLVAILLADQQITLEEATAARSAARVKKVMTDFKVSLDLYQKLLELHQKGKDREAIATACIDLAEFNRATFNHKIGLHYIAMAEEVFSDTLWPPRLESRMLGRASALYSEGFPGDERALDLSYRALEIANRLEDKELIATSCNELGFLLNSEASVAYYKRAVDIWSELDRPIKESRVSLNLARYYMSSVKLDQGIGLAIEVLRKARINNWSNIRWSATELLAAGYAKKGNRDSASVYTIRALQEATALHEERRSVELTQALAKYEATIAQKELVIQKQELKNANSELEAQSLKQKLMLTMVIGLALGLLLFVFLYRKIQKSNRKLQNQQVITAQVNNELKDSLTHREMLMQEVHHRVKNNLQIVSSILNIQSKNVTDEVALEVLLRTRERVKAIALIHEQLYKTNDISEVNFKSYLSNLNEYVRGAIVSDAVSVKISIKCERVFMSLDEAIPLGLIVNEALVNSLKYAFRGRKKGSIRIEYYIDDSDDAILQISDDGVGLLNTTLEAKESTLGSRLIELLARQLRGSLHISSSDGFGINLRYPTHPQNIEDQDHAKSNDSIEVDTSERVVV